MSAYLRDRAQVGDAMEFTGPVGSFYLREIKRPLLFLAGGTGLAPFLSMLRDVLARRGQPTHPVHLVYGVTNDPDLVGVDKLRGVRRTHRRASRFASCVADRGQRLPAQGLRHAHIEPEHLNDGDVDVYLCGPPPMVDAVRG